METIKISAARRSDTGKSAARRLRASGSIPATAYGKGMQCTSLAVAPKDMKRVLGSEYGRNNVLELDVDGEKFPALLKDYQYHPLTRELLHADFARISLEQPVDVDVPFELTGKPAGVVKGGVLRQVYRLLPVRCLPEKIPVKLSRDVTALELDSHVHAEDLELPEGVTVRLPPKQTVCAVVMEKLRDLGEDAAAVPGAAGAAVDATAAAAAPATGDAAKDAEAAPAEKKDRKGDKKGDKKSAKK